MKPKITYIFYLLGLGFIFFGTQKFGAENVVFAIIAERSSFDVFEPVIRRLTGVAEILTGLALFLPRAQKLATLSGFAILLGAMKQKYDPNYFIHQRLLPLLQTGQRPLTPQRREFHRTRHSV